eukprot:2708293-Pleurochrysis_carterae.AAC.2
MRTWLHPDAARPRRCLHIPTCTSRLSQSLLSLHDGRSIAHRPYFLFSFLTRVDRRRWSHDALCTCWCRPCYSGTDVCLIHWYSIRLDSSCANRRRKGSLRRVAGTAR